MSLSIRNATLSLSVQRMLTQHTGESQRLSAQMASGVRVNSARDDAAGQALAARMSSGLKGLDQARRNINDGTSMLQVADGALANIGDSLQRLRELAVAGGNGAYSNADRTTLQAEADQILSGITDVANSTAFNGQAIFSTQGSGRGDPKKAAVVDALKAGWLSSAEDMVQQYYGLQGDGSTLEVKFDDTDGQAGVLASVAGSAAPGTPLTLNLDMADFGNAGASADGGTGPLYNDRVVAHEMVHAVMMKSTSMNFPQWFVEGTAELIQGADERVAGALAGGNTADNIVSNIANGGFSYEGGYVASRFLHDRLKQMGVDGGIKGLMTYLGAHKSSDLDTALKAVTNNAYSGQAAFLADFGAHGAAFITGQMNLTNADTGAIGGLDADGGPSRDAKGVVSEAGYNGGSGHAVMRNFKVKFPDVGTAASGTRRVQIQLGPSAGDLVDMQFNAVNASALGLGDLDMKDTAVSLLRIDEALAAVNEQRVTIGAYGNRLDFAAGNVGTQAMNLEAAHSRIQDVDYASSTVQLTRQQILQEAATAMLGQANGEARAVLALLR
jgi:flagellin